MVLFKSASTPTAVLASPVVLSKSAAAPTAVFSLPVFRERVPAPTAVLKPASTLLSSDNAPTAVFAKPVLVSRLKRAFWPSAVLSPGYPPSGGGLTACAFGKSVEAVSVRIRKMERQ